MVAGRTCYLFHVNVIGCWLPIHHDGYLGIVSDENVNWKPQVDAVWSRRL